MLIYRYEAEDGGGPWFYKNGTIRHPLPYKNLYLKNQEEYLYGSTSLENLLEYCSIQEADINNCILKTYDIPDNEIIEVSGWQIKFPKKYAGID